MREKILAALRSAGHGITPNSLRQSAFPTHGFIWGELCMIPELIEMELDHLLILHRSSGGAGTPRGTITLVALRAPEPPPNQEVTQVLQAVTHTPNLPTPIASIYQPSVSNDLPTTNTATAPTLEALLHSGSAIEILSALEELIDDRALWMSVGHAVEYLEDPEYFLARSLAGGRMSRTRRFFSHL